MWLKGRQLACRMPLHTKSLPCPSIKYFQNQGLNVWLQKLVKRFGNLGQSTFTKNTTTNRSLWVVNLVCGWWRRTFWATSQKNCGTWNRSVKWWTLTELLLLNFLPSTYTITAISWPPPFDLTTFFTLATLNRTTLFLQPSCFCADIFMVIDADEWHTIILYSIVLYCRS